MGLRETEMQNPYLGKRQRPFSIQSPQRDVKDPEEALTPGRKDIPDIGGGGCFQDLPACWLRNNCFIVVKLQHGGRTFRFSW